MKIRLSDLPSPKPGSGVLQTQIGAIVEDGEAQDKEGDETLWSDYYGVNSTPSPNAFAEAPMT